MNKTKKFFDSQIEAFNVLADHTNAYLNINCLEIESMSIEEMFENVYAECAHILASNWKEGKYSIKEYFLIRNELAKLLGELYKREKA